MGFTILLLRSPATSLEFTILLLRSPAIFLGFTILLLRSPAISLGFTILGESCFFFFNPIIEVATFRLRGLCMLGVFLLLAFTRPGHECQDLLSPCDGMHVFTIRPRFILSSERVFGGNGVRNHVNSKGKIPSTE